MFITGAWRMASAFEYALGCLKSGPPEGYPDERVSEQGASTCSRGSATGDWEASNEQLAYRFVPHFGETHHSQVPAGVLADGLRWVFRAWRAGQHVGARGARI